MTARTIRWAANRPDGTPIVIDGVVADVDEETGHATLDERAREVVDEVVAFDVAPTKAVVVPTIDLASAVHQLIQAKHRAGVPVRSRLPEQASASKEPSHEPRNAPGTTRIDAILSAIYSAIQRAYGNTTGKALPTISVDELYAGPIGQTLVHLLGIANGTEVRSTANLFRLIDELHILLPQGVDESTGRSLEELEAEALRRTVTLEDGTLATWSDPRTQRTNLLRRSVEEKKEADQSAQDENPKLLKWWE